MICHVPPSNLLKGIYHWYISIVAILTSVFWLLTPSLHAQTLVTITDTLKNADGTNAAGRVVISWDPFTAASGETIDGGTLTYTITNGVVSLSLAPNIGATPAGTSYRAQYYLTNRASYRETWVIPATGPVAIAAIRVSTVPTPTVLFNAATQLTNFDMSAQTFTRPVKLGTTLPATCTVGDLFVDTDLTPAGQQVYLCTATDTWNLVGDGGAGGSSHNLLSATHLDSTAGTVLRGDLVVGQTATPKWQRLALGTSGQYVRSDGTDALWAAILDGDLPSSIARDSELHSAAHVLANTSGLGADHTTSGLTAGQVLRATGAAAAAFTSIQDADLPATIARDSELHAQSHGEADHTGDVIPDATQVFGANFYDISEIAAPANPGAGVVRVYAKTGTGELCSRDSAGSENCMSTGSGGANHNLLSATHSDTTAGTVARGDLVVGQSATPSWQRLAIGTANQVFATDGTDPSWTTLAKAHLPSSIAFEDEANIFTAAGGLTMDNQLGVRMREATGNGTNYIEFRAAAALAATVTWTMPAADAAGVFRSNGSGTVTLEGETGTGNFVRTSSPTIITPTIASLVNMTHTHQDAAGGGTIDGAAITAGTVVAARLPNLESLNGTLDVPSGGTGATTLTGLLQGNGTSAFTAIANSSTVGQVLRVTGASAYSWGALDLADGDAVTGLLPDGNIAAALMRDSELAAFTVTKTNMTYDAEGTGNSLTIPFKIFYRAAICQNVTASIGFSTPTSNAPTAECVTGTNTQYAVLNFDAATAESVQDNFFWPVDGTGNIDLDIVWRSATTTLETEWNIQTVCVNDAETGDPAFNTASEVIDTTKGTADQFNEATISSITITGCAAGEMLFWKFSRDAADADDDMTGDADLISLTFTIRRAM